MRTLLQITIFSLITLIATTANAKLLYVNASTGDDTTTYAENDINNPWRTLGRATFGGATWAQQNSSEAAQAGDTVYVAAGTYSAAGLNERYAPAFLTANSGNATSGYITFEAQGRVELQLSSGAGPTIGAYQRSYIKWKGFYIDEANAQPRADTGPVVIFSSDHIIIEECEIRGRIQTWEDNHNGIRFENSNNSVARNNTIYGIQHEANPSHHNNAGIMLYTSDDIIMEGNEIYTTGAGIFPKGGGANITIRNNLIHNVNKAIRVSYADAGNNRIYQNVLRDSTTGINLAEGTQDYTVANNTIYNTDQGINISQSTGVSNLTFRNNLVANIRTAFNAWILPTKVYTADNQLYYWATEYAHNGSVVNTLDSWKSLISDETNSIYENPGFVDENNNDLKLTAGSPARDAGVDILDLDNDGSTTDPITIGAYITGNEIIGQTIVRPAAPTNLVIVVSE